MTLFSRLTVRFWTGVGSVSSSLTGSPSPFWLWAAKRISDPVGSGPSVYVRAVASSSAVLEASKSWPGSRHLMTYLVTSAPPS